MVCGSFSMRQKGNDDVLHVASSVHKIAVRLCGEPRSAQRAARELLALNDSVATGHPDVSHAFTKALAEALRELSTSSTEGSRLGAAEACLSLTNAVHIHAELATLLHNVLHILLDTQLRSVAEKATTALCALIARAGHAGGLIVEAECTRSKQWLAERKRIVASTTALKMLAVASVHVVPHIAVLLKLLWTVLLKADASGSEPGDAAAAMQSLVVCLLQHDALNGQHIVEAFCAVLLLGMTAHSEREQRAAATALCSIVEHLPQKLINAVSVTALTLSTPSPLLALLLAKLASAHPARRGELVAKGMDVARLTLQLPGVPSMSNGRKSPPTRGWGMLSQTRGRSTSTPSLDGAPSVASTSGSQRNNASFRDDTGYPALRLVGDEFAEESLMSPTALQAVRLLLTLISRHGLHAVLDAGGGGGGAGGGGVAGGAAHLQSHHEWLASVLRCSMTADALGCSVLFFRMRRDTSALKTALSHITTFPAGERGPLLRQVSLFSPLRLEAENVSCQMAAAELEGRDNSAQLINTLPDVAECPLSASGGCAFLSAYVVPCCTHRSSDVRLQAYRTLLVLLCGMKSSRGEVSKRGSSTEGVQSILRETLAAIVCESDGNSRFEGFRMVEELVPQERLVAVCSAEPCSLCLGLDDVSEDIRRCTVDLLCKRCVAAAPVREKLAMHLKHSEYILRNHPSSSRQADSAYHAGMCYAALYHTTQQGEAASGLLPLLIQKLDAAPASSLLQHSLLEAVSSICEVDWASIPPAAPQLVPILVRAIQQQEVSKCTRPALSTLARVLQCSGDVFSVFESHKGLYHRLLTMLSHGRGATSETRVEIMRLLGVLGAVEPSLSHKLSLTDDSKDTTQKDFSSAWSTITTLLHVLEQPWHAAHHDAAAKAILDILAIIGPRRACLQVPRVVPCLFKLLSVGERDDCVRCNSAAGGSPVLWQAVGSVLSTPGVMPESIAPVASPLADLVQRQWGKAELPVKAAMATIVASLVRLGCNIGCILETFIPVLCEAAVEDYSHSRLLAVKACAALEEVHAKLTPCSMRLTCECVAALLTDPGQGPEVKLACLHATASFIGESAFSESAPVMVRALMQVLTMANGRPPASHSLGSGFEEDASSASGPGDVSARCAREAASLLREIFSKKPLRQQVATLQYAAMDVINANPLLHEMLLTDDSPIGDSFSDSTFDGGGAGVMLPQNCSVGVQEVRSALYVKETCTHGDFIKWYDALCLALLRQSPRNVLRAAAGIAEQLPLIARALLNVSFAVCHRDLLQDQPEVGEEMLDTLEEALRADLPEEVLRPLLDLSDYLERFSIFEERVGPAGQGSSTRLLRMVNPAHQAHLAESCGLYTKALRLAEHCDISEASSYRQLVRVNVHLGLVDAADGITRMVHTVDISDAAMYADLGLWDEALTRYEAQLNQPQVTAEGHREVVVGLLTALDKQSDWHRMLQCVDRYWTHNEDDELKRKIAPMVAHGAWLMSQWELLDEATSLLETDPCTSTPTGVMPTPSMFYQAVLGFQKGAYEEVRHNVQLCRQFVDKRMATSSNHAYHLLVLLQHLTEVEEMIEFRTNPSAERRGMLKRLWQDRITGMQRNARHLHDTHTLRTLVLSRRDNIDEWIDFAKLTHQLGQTDIAKQLLRSLASDVVNESTGPRDTSDCSKCKLQLAQCQLQWDVLMDQAALGTDEVAVLESRSMRLIQTVQGIVERIEHRTDAAECHSQACMTLATWRHSLDHPLADVIAPLGGLLSKRPEMYHAWSLWATINTKALYRKDALPEDAARHALIREVVHGLDNCISLESNPDMQLQEALRLLHLAYFHLDDSDLPEDVGRAIHATCKKVPPRLWATLSPQLVARLSSGMPAALCDAETPADGGGPGTTKLQDLAVDLLTDLAQAYPQVVLYPLVIEGDTDGGKRVLSSLGEEWRTLYDEARAVVKELLRLVETWDEKWISALARIHTKISGGGTVNPVPLMQLLTPLYAMVRTQSTSLERQFVARHAERLMTLDEAFGRWRNEAERPQHGNPNTYHAMLRVKAAVLDLWRALHKSLPPAITLREAAPRLAELRRSPLHVPGTSMSDPPVCIMSLENTVHVIASVHRPRKLTFFGSDGAQHSFLLKGKEDVRLDQRIMQFLELSNMLLRRSADAQQRMNHIITYPVVPVARKVGLFGWVDQTDNIECVISEVRQKGAPDELTVAAQHFGLRKLDWEDLRVAARVDALEVIERSCPGDALQIAMWIRAANSEVWLERRTAFARSLSIMSVMGYVIGLGDRHLGNILLHGTSGRVAHIDFEECFEAAMRRRRYPECVPFRLTRQLRSAMGAGGAGGVFRMTAISTTQALRVERHAILALIESFIYEPLPPDPTHDAPPDSACILSRIRQKLEGTDDATPPQAAAAKPEATQQNPSRACSGAHLSPGGCSAAVGYPTSLYAACAPGVQCGSVGYPRALYAQGGGGGGGGGSPQKKDCRSLGYPASLYAPPPSGQAAPRSGQRQARAKARDVALGLPERFTSSAESPQAQVDRLIQQASSLDSLARMYKGWRPWV